MKNPKKIFSKAYDRYVEKIYRFVFLKVNSKEIAQDLTSETFLKGWEAFQQRYEENAKKPIENMQAFLYQIARNLIVDHYRGKDNPAAIPDSGVIDPRSDIQQAASLRSDLDMVKQSLAGLKQEYQDVIIWHYLDDLPIREVAKLLDRSEPTTRVLLSRALKKLRNEIEEI
ncbi:MAG: RNA polymerase sigma factor [bacterium]